MTIEPVQGQVVDERAEYERARRLSAQIVDGASMIRQAWVLLAAKIAEFEAASMWKPLGYESFDGWLGSPEIQLSRNHALRLIRAHRFLVEERSVDPKSLRALDIEKVDAVLPAIRRGEVTVEQGLSDCEVLSRTDVTEKYRRGRGPDAPLDAEQEPERAPCPRCGSWVEAERLKGAA
jgi:hypothetical protein